MKPPIRNLPVNLIFLASLAHNVHATLLHRRGNDTGNKPKHDATFVIEACLIPILVIFSGILAGLTLGYMSLDETQLRVLSVSGTPQQQAYARKIEPIRKNGHLLLTTLLLGNMIVNETLPILSENVLGGGLQAVVVSTILIVVFAEIIPQSLCSRFGLQIGAYMAVPTRVLMYALFIIAWPIAKLLEFTLGPHHGIVYRKDELKELVNMHAAVSHHGGDLQSDTVTMVGGALDFQEKIVKDAMTPIDDVFMLSIDSRLDYEILAKVVQSGHSRVPVYELYTEGNGTITKAIVGILLVKQCVLLDPEDATPLRDIPLNTVPTVPFDEPLLHTLDRFQQGNSHMAVVSRIPTKTESKAKPGSVNEEAKVGLTRRFLNRVGFGDDSSTSSSESDTEGDENSKSSTKHSVKLKKGVDKSKQAQPQWLPWNNSVALEQTMPSDAMLNDENATKFLEGLQRSPLGIITLEDVIEELIGEEILDEFDLKGANALPASTYVPAEAQAAVDAAAARHKLVLAEAARLTEGAVSATPPHGSTTRVAQGLRAIRMAAGASPIKRKSSSHPGTKRTVITASTTPSSYVPGSPETGLISRPTEENNIPLPVEVSLTPQSEPAIPSFMEAKTSPRCGSPVPGSPAHMAPVLLGIADENAPLTKQASGHKRGAFKSLIGGGRATPGLDKRVDPTNSNAAMSS